jgi:hypothetical protein
MEEGGLAEAVKPPSGYENILSVCKENKNCT